MDARTAIFASLIAVTISNAGCFRANQLNMPDITVDTSFEALKGMENPQTSVKVAWWREFGDETLNALVSRAVTKNLDVSIAMDRLAEARAMLSETRADLYPSAQASGTYRAENTNVQSQRNDSTHYYNTGIDALWEADLWGRVRQSVNAQDQVVNAFRANLQDVLITVIAEVGQNYMDLRGSQLRLAIAQKNLKVQNETLSVTKARFKAGQAAELDTFQARAIYEATAASLPGLESNIRAAAHRIAVLLGEQPHTLLQELCVVQPIPALPKNLNIGDPASLLERRPDIREAKNFLSAEIARVGLAEKDFFPRVTLFGSIGAGRVEGTSQSTYSFGPSFSWAILDLNRLVARLRAAESRAGIAATSFEKTVLTALEEVETGFQRYSASVTTSKHLQEAVKASERAATLAKRRYSDGSSDFLAVLDAQRSSLDFETSLANSQLESLKSLVTLYKALGGGWQVAEPFQS